MSVLPELGLVRSGDLDEVLAAVDHDHAPYAGGTELVPAMGLGLRQARAPSIRSRPQWPPRWVGPSVSGPPSCP